MRVKKYISTACYLIDDDKVLFIKFNKKWGLKYAPPGGKVEERETPTECILREFKEETGLELINPKLKIISNWKDSEEGIIFIYICNNSKGELKESLEGKLEWIDINNIDNLEQFDMNKKFNKYLFENGIYEAKFLLEDNTDVIEYEIREV